MRSQQVYAQLSDFSQRGELSLLEIKHHFRKHKKHGILFYPNASLALVGPSDKIELYLAYRPILGCQNAFPVSYHRYRHYNDENDQQKYLIQQYEVYYDQSASGLGERFFREMSVYKAENFIWFYKAQNVDSKLQQE